MMSRYSGGWRDGWVRSRGPGLALRDGRPKGTTRRTGVLGIVQPEHPRSRCAWVYPGYPTPPQMRPKHGAHGGEEGSFCFSDSPHHRRKISICTVRVMLALAVWPKVYNLPLAGCGSSLVTHPFLCLPVPVQHLVDDLGCVQTLLVAVRRGGDLDGAGHTVKGLRVVCGEGKFQMSAGSRFVALSHASKGGVAGCRPHLQSGSKGAWPFMGVGSSSLEAAPKGMRQAAYCKGHSGQHGGGGEGTGTGPQRTLVVFQAAV